MNASIESRVAKLEKSGEAPPLPVILTEGTTTVEQARAEWEKDHPGQPKPVFVVLPRNARL